MGSFHSGVDSVPEVTLSDAARQDSGVSMGRTFWRCISLHVLFVSDMVSSSLLSRAGGARYASGILWILWTLSAPVLASSMPSSILKRTASTLLLDTIHGFGSPSALFITSTFSADV